MASVHPCRTRIFPTSIPELTDASAFSSDLRAAVCRKLTLPDSEIRRAVIKRITGIYENLCCGRFTGNCFLLGNSFTIIVVVI